MLKNPKYSTGTLYHTAIKQLPNPKTSDTAVLGKRIHENISVAIKFLKEGLKYRTTHPIFKCFKNSTASAIITRQMLHTYSKHRKQDSEELQFG